MAENEAPTWKVGFDNHELKSIEAMNRAIGTNGKWCQQCNRFYPDPGHSETCILVDFKG